MPEPAQDMIINNLIEALNRLHDDLDRVEFWAAVVGSFQQAAPEYQPVDPHRLPTIAPARRPRR